MSKEKIMNLTVISGVVLLITGSMAAFLTGAFGAASVICVSAGGVLTLFYLVVNREKVKTIITSKKARYGINALIYSLVVLAVLAVIQAIAFFNSAQIDLTKTKKHTLAGQTKKVLDSLEHPVNAYYFYSVRARNYSVEDTLKKYEKAASKFTFRSIDVDKNPSFARKFNVNRYGVVVLHREDNDASEKIDTLTEEGITNGLVRISREEKKKIYFTAGHGEHSLDAPQNDKQGYSILKEELKSYNYKVEEIKLFESPKGVPEDCSLLVIGGPKMDFFEREINALKKYVSGGGKMFVLAGPFAELPRLKNMLAEYGLKFHNDVVISADNISRMLGGDALTPIISDYGAHEITRKIMRTAVFMPMTGSFETDSGKEGIDITGLLKTNESTWGETNKEALDKGVKFDKNRDIEPPLTVGALVTVDGGKSSGGNKNEKNEAKKAEIAVYGSSAFAANSYIGAASNRDLILNTVSYLAADEDLISIRPKERSFEPLFISETQKNMIRVIPMIFLPLVVIAVGAMVYIRRRRG